jgi:hypothetical protein
LPIACGHKQQLKKIGSGRNDSCGGGGGGYGSGKIDGDRDGDGNENWGGNRYGNGDSGNNNGNAGDDGVDGSNGDDGADGGGVEEIGGGGGGSGDGGGDGCGNALGRLPSVNDATFVTTTFLSKTNDVDALSGVCKGPPTNDRLDPASYG